MSPNNSDSLLYFLYRQHFVPFFLPNSFFSSLKMRLGAGSYGQVIRGTAGGTPVALKYLPIGEAGITSLREIDILSRFRHPSLIPLLHIDFTPVTTIQAPLLPSTYVVLQLQLADSDLGVRVEQRPLTYLEVLSYAMQITSALLFLEQHNVSHVDIKPDNVLVRGEQVYVADLGLSCYRLHRLPSSFTPCPAECQEGGDCPIACQRRTAATVAEESCQGASCPRGGCAQGTPSEGRCLIPDRAFATSYRSPELFHYWSVPPEGRSFRQHRDLTVPPVAAIAHPENIVAIEERVEYSVPRGAVVWALGALFFFMVTRDHLLPGFNIVGGRVEQPQAMLRAYQSIPQRVQSVAAPYQALQPLLQSMLDGRRSHRPSLQRVLAMLQELASPPSVTSLRSAFQSLALTSTASSFRSLSQPSSIVNLPPPSPSPSSTPGITIALTRWPVPPFDGDEALSREYVKSICRIFRRKSTPFSTWRIETLCLTIDLFYRLTRRNEDNELLVRGILAIAVGLLERNNLPLREMGSWDRVVGKEMEIVRRMGGALYYANLFTDSPNLETLRASFPIVLQPLRYAEYRVQCVTGGTKVQGLARPFLREMEDVLQLGDLTEE